MRNTLHTLQRLAEARTPIAALTCYDASFATLLEKAGVDLLLVGDSLGMVIQGGETTLSVTMRDMLYHTRAVTAGSATAFIVSDMPSASYQASPEQAYRNAARLLAAGAQMVKIEGGAVMRDTVAFLTERGVPVCAHLGLTPQSVHQLGGYHVQARDAGEAEELIAAAHQLVSAGAQMVLLEAIPRALAERVTAEVGVPTIGIGAGPDCSGQVLVLYDAIGIYPGKTPRFAQNFMDGAATIDEAVRRYVEAVKRRRFPDQAHSFD